MAPGTNNQTNLNAMLTLAGNCIFTNTALTDDGDVWWEGMTETPPAHLTDWKGQDWTPDSGTTAAHPNARFTAPASQDPAIAPEWEDPAGVPISAILFGGRRSSVVPLITEAFDWQHGVFLGSIMASETTAAAAGAVGKLRRDPFAMLPFCGYNMADYIAHWLEIGREADAAKLPRLFYVNWFRKGSDGKFLWPGYGENSRVLEWVFERCAGRGEAVETPIGYLPAPGAIPTDGLDIAPEAMTELLKVDPVEWRQETRVDGGRGYDNPFFTANVPISTAYADRVFGNLSLDWTPATWFKLAYTLGVDYSGDSRLQGEPQTSSNTPDPLGQVAKVDLTNSQIDHNLTGTLSYKVSPSFAGTFTLGQNLNTRSVRQLGGVGNALLAPRTVYPDQHGEPASTDRQRDQAPDRRLFRAGYL